MTISEELTYSTIRLQAFYDDESVSYGTGFFMNFNINEEKNTYQPVIITNKHVVNGAKYVKYSICKSDINDNPIDNEIIEVKIDNLLIFNHPDPDVDLCAISVAKAESELVKNGIKFYKKCFEQSSIISDDELINCSVMEDVFMIGYPDGLQDSYNNKPIIRKGITSTHIKNDYNNKKEFLIDMACFPGSSGSPIVIFNEGMYHIGNDVTIGNRLRLIGVLFAGPQHTAEGKIVFEYIPTQPVTVVNIPNNLGLVIKATRILELERYIHDNVSD